MRAAESKCLQRTPKGVRAARKGIGGLLPGAESRSSEVRVSDGMPEPIPEDSLHYCLLLGGGDTNDRGEGVEGSNTPVCRPRGVQKTLMRGPSSGRDRACAKTDPFSERGEAWLSHLVGGQGIRKVWVRFPPTLLSLARSSGGESGVLIRRRSWVQLPPRRLIWDCGRQGNAPVS